MNQDQWKKTFFQDHLLYVLEPRFKQNAFVGFQVPSGGPDLGMAVSLMHGAELEQNQGHLGGLQREAGARLMPSCLCGKYHEPDSNKHTAGKATDTPEKPQVWSVFITGHPGEVAACLLSGLFPKHADRWEGGSSLGPGRDRSGEVRESPPPPTEAITVTAASPPSSPRAGQNIMGCTGHSSNPQGPPISIQWIWSAPPGNRGTDMNQTIGGSLRPGVSERILAEARGLGNAASNSLKLECQSSRCSDLVIRGFYWDFQMHSQWFNTCNHRTRTSSS